MSDEPLIRLAEAAGLSIDWIDADNRQQRVTPDVLREVLACLGLAALAVVIAWDRGPGKAAFNGLVVLLLLVVPAVRSVRRWDEHHPGVRSGG